MQTSCFTIPARRSLVMLPWMVDLGSWKRRAVSEGDTSLRRISARILRLSSLVTIWMPLR